MSIASFIREHRADLIEDWIRYARQLQPAAGKLSENQLRNSGAEILMAIAANMERRQSEAQQTEKSFGTKSEGDAGFDSISVLHADDRRTQGFGLNDVVAEFRALRASVLRRWLAFGNIDPESIQEMMRFNEAIDQALSESVHQYTKKVERARDLFAGVLAHDLRAPLAVLQNVVEIMQRDDTISPAGLRVSAIVQRSTLRMRTMIDDLLIFTRARMGQIQATNLTSLSMHTLCSSAIEEAQVLYPDASITLNCRGSPLGKWDAGQMGQLLSNLLSNAARYGDGTIGLSIEDQGEWLELTVSNGGEPLPPSALPTLFDPLTRSTPRPDGRSWAAGIGLGLFICKSIVCAHQGTIRVESNAQRTTFTIRLPRSAA